MPLFHGKSKSDFGHNVKEEMHEGRPLKQSLAIAYSMKHRSKKAHGGMCAHGADMTCPKCTYPKDSASQNDPTKMEHMAKGGMLTKDGYQSSRVGDLTHPDLADHEMDEYDESQYNKKHPMHADKMAMHEDRRRLGQHGEIEEGPQGVPPNSPRDELHDRAYTQQTDNYSDEEDGDGTDMVGRIIAQRQRMFSEGGKVSNEDELEADFSPNEFDDLHLRDGLEQHDTGANSGDELGDAQEDDDRDDIVSRIMRSRRKGPGHNPRPA